MIDSLFGFLVTNTLIAALLGLTAVAVWRFSRNAAWTHALLLLALAKLVTPSFVPIEVPWVRDGAEVVAERSMGAPVVVVAGSSTADEVDAPGSGRGPALPQAVTPPEHVEAVTGPSAAMPAWVPWDLLGALAVAVWTLGGLAVMVIAVHRGRRFAGLIGRAELADLDVITIAGELASQLGLGRVPDVRIVDARVSPLVFRWFGRSTVVLPRVCIAELDPRELRAVLAHELSHVANRDHLTRWLETAVAIVHWWNPVAGWIRGRLRESEELRCDGRAVTVLESGARHYGRTILKTVSYVDGDLAGLPLAASGLGSPDSLKMRLQMIAQQKTHHRLSLIGKGALALGAAALLPLGLTAQDKKPSPDRAAKLEQIRQLLRELRQDVAGEASKGETEEIVEIKTEPKPVLRWQTGDGKPGQVIVEENEERGEHDAKSDSSNPKQVKTRRWVMRSGDEGEQVAIELDGEALEIPDAVKKLMDGHGGFKFDMDVSVGDDEFGGFPKGLVKLFGTGAKDDDADDDDDGDENQQRVIRIGKGVGGQNAFVWRFEGGDENGLPEHVQKLIEAHGEGDGKPHAFVLRTTGDDDAADGQHPIVKILKMREAQSDEPGNFEVRVVSPEGEGSDGAATIHFAKPQGGAEGEHGGVFVIRGIEGNDAPKAPAKAARTAKRAKSEPASSDDESGDAEIRAQIDRLEAQLRAIEKKLDKLRSRQV